MKSKDLMIGDWVYSRGRTERVTSIYDGYICTEHFKYSHDYFFDPIPLTPEILEKNGWEWDGELWVTDDFLIENGYDYYNRFWWSVFNSPLLPINSVHELQHALRLCGIEKEIVL